MRIIGGKYKGKKLIPPLSLGTRPTADRTREMIFNVLLHNPHFGAQTLIDKSALDVFAGTGAMGLEALSRGAQSVTFIENDNKSLSVLHKNIESFHASHCRVLEKNALYLGLASAPFSLIFIDPPYGQNLVLPTLHNLFSNGWISSQAAIVVEIGKNESFPLPSFLSLVVERVVGAAKIMFFQVHIS